MCRAISAVRIGGGVEFIDEKSSVENTGFNGTADRDGDSCAGVRVDSMNGLT